MKYVVVLLVLLGGCATRGEIEISYQVDRYGVPTPVVNGKAYPLSDAERLRIAQNFVNAYCAEQE